MTTTSERRSGEVIFWNHDKLYGFIRANNAEGVEQGDYRDLFFHFRACQYPVNHFPQIGDKVTFITAPDKRYPDKPSARQVRLEGQETQPVVSAGMFAKPDEAMASNAPAWLTRHQQ